MNFLSLDLFSLMFKKYFYGRLTGAIAPPHGSVADLDFSQSKWYTRWQHLAVQSTSSRFRFCSVMGRTVHESAFNITKHIKSKCSHSALGTSLTLVVKTETLGYQDPCFPAWHCQLAHRTVPVALLFSETNRKVSSECVYCCRRTNKAVGPTYISLQLQ